MNDRLISIAQILLSTVFLSGFFTSLILFQLGFGKIPEGQEQSFSQLQGILSAGCLLILQFWYSRSRPGTATTASST